MIAFGQQNAFRVGNANNVQIEWSGEGVYFAERFTAPSTFVVSGISIRTPKNNWNGSIVIGIQANNGGVPDNTWLTSGEWLTSSGTNSQAGAWGRFKLPPYMLNSGTLYHIVLQPSGAAGVLGAGSITRIHSSLESGTFFYTRILGSILNEVQENNFANFISYDAGATWVGSLSGNFNNPAGFVLYESGAVGAAGEDKIVSKGVYQNIANNALTAIELDGMYFKMDKTRVISGAFTYCHTVNNGLGQGSLWLRLEYSGVMIDGKREEIGSVIFTVPTFAGTNSTGEFYAELHQGSRIYAWLYGSGVGIGRADTEVGGAAPFTAGAGTYGTTSGANITSTNAGSTVTFNNSTDICLYFAESGAGGQVQVETPYYNLGNSFGGTFSQYG